jgi:hypothetical protein
MTDIHTWWWTVEPLWLPLLLLLMIALAILAGAARAGAFDR